jgi:ABC-type dipeptide/oligopeptide/nickel transport system ATPase component
VDGSIKLDGRELVGLRHEDLRQIRGNEIAMVFQDPLTSLDPTKTIGYQVAEPVRLHRARPRQQALDRAVEVLGLVGLPRPKERLDDYPHQLSGGLRQRVMIAMALACEPKLLIADEPTTALDVTIQAQILTCSSDLKDRLGMAMLLITHDMGVVAGHADRINVMYAGRVVETTEVRRAVRAHAPPVHPGPARASIPRLEPGQRQKALHAIPGLPPDLASPPQGCRFAPGAPGPPTSAVATSRRWPGRRRRAPVLLLAPGGRARWTEVVTGGPDAGAPGSPMPRTLGQRDQDAAGDKVGRRRPAASAAAVGATADGTSRRCRGGRGGPRARGDRGRPPGSGERRSRTARCCVS